MPKTISSCSLRLFADDSLLYKQVTSQVDADSLQADLDSLVNWANKWQMHFNNKKCEHIRIARPTVKNSGDVRSYNFNGEPLKSVDDVMYLGIRIDKRLSFDKHINDVCSKATHTLHMLMRNLKKAKTKTRATAYKTVCRPILQYACTSWSRKGPICSSWDLLSSTVEVFSRFAAASSILSIFLHSSQ